MNWNLREFFSRENEFNDFIKKIKNEAIIFNKTYKDNLEKLHEISDFLLKEETITGEQFMEILNKKPVENRENPKEEPSNENTLEEKAIEDDIKTSDDKKENSSEISNEDLKKELEETLKENEEKSSDKDLDDTIALGSSEQSNQEDE